MPSDKGAGPRQGRDRLAELHAYRSRLAKRFNYDTRRLIEYIYCQPLPPGVKVIEISPRKKQLV